MPLKIVKQGQPFRTWPDFAVRQAISSITKLSTYCDVDIVDEAGDGNRKMLARRLSPLTKLPGRLMSTGGPQELRIGYVPGMVFQA